jgi:hypothetical protein
MLFKTGPSFSLTFPLGTIDQPLEAKDLQPGRSSLYPDISLDLLFDNRVDDLLRDEVDVAVRVMSEPPQQMAYTDLILSPLRV